ncbi:MAG: DUF928 domain-containing protein [Cyanobacteriota bacterium]
MIYKTLFQLEKTIAIAVTVLGISHSFLLPAKATPIQSKSALSALTTAKLEQRSLTSFSLTHPHTSLLEPFPSGFRAPQGQRIDRNASRPQQNTTLQAQIPIPKDRGAPGQREGAGTRSPFSLSGKPLTALVPMIQPRTAPKSQHPALANLLPGSVLGLTLSGHPTFWFYFPYSLTPTRPVEFVLQDEKGEEVYKTLLSESGTTPGVVGFQLPATAPSLELNKRYNWYLMVYFDAKQSPEEAVYVSGWVERVALNPSLVKNLEQATPKELVALYEKAGIWHEAITALAQQRHQNPQDATSKQEWEKLMRSIQLEALTSEPITSMLSPKP